MAAIYFLKKWMDESGNTGQHKCHNAVLIRPQNSFSGSQGEHIGEPEQADQKFGSLFGYNE
jgi:hypothetical protein